MASARPVISTLVTDLHSLNDPLPLNNRPTNHFLHDLLLHDTLPHNLLLYNRSRIDLLLHDGCGIDLGDYRGRVDLLNNRLGVALSHGLR